MNAAKEAEIVVALIADVRRMKSLTAQLPPRNARLVAEMRGGCDRATRRLRHRREDLQTFLSHPETPSADRAYIADLVGLFAIAESELSGEVR